MTASRPFQNPPLFLLMVLSLALSACGAGKSPEDASTVPKLQSGIPKALAKARLVFETKAGVHLQTPGKPAKLLVEGGAWPRWSPDGRRVAVLKGDKVCVVDPQNGELREVAQTGTPKSLVFSGDGSEIWFTDGKQVKAVNLETSALRVLAEDGEFLEIDSGPQGKTLVATVKSFGYRIKVFDLETGKNWSLGKGCSASFSPDGTRVTNNLDGHRELAVLIATDGSREKVLRTPAETRGDNQFWSNHPEWIMAMEEEKGRLMVHRVSDGAVWMLSDTQGADRPDLWVP